MVSFIGIAFTHQSAIAKQLDDWQLLPRPQHLTELYFADDTQLHSAIKLRAKQPVTFIIHNMEYQTTTYHYSLIAVASDSNATLPLESGVLVLPHNHSQTISEKIKIPSLSSRIAIRVELEYQGLTFGDKALSTQRQSIQFWEQVVGIPA